MSENAIPAAPDLTLQDLLAAGPIARIENPYHLYSRLRRDDPVGAIRASPDPAVFVSRFDDVHEVLRDHQRFSSCSNTDGGIGLVIGRTIIGMDGHEHLRHRALITPSLAPRALRGEFPRIVARIAHELVDNFAGSGTADLVSDFTFLYPLRVFTEILGLPASEVATFHHWAIDLSHVAKDPGRGIAAASAIREYLGKIIERKRAALENDLISQLASAEVDGTRLTDDDVIGFLCLLVIAGAETTYHLMGSALAAMLANRELLGAAARDRGLIAPILQETLRWESPVQIITRRVAEDTTLSGVRLSAGTEVVVCIGSANRDETRFPDPDRFDVHRSGEEHIAFGFGRHYCAGSRLAMLEATVGLNTLLDRLPELRLAEPANPARILGVAFRGPDHLRVRFHSG